MNKIRFVKISALLREYWSSFYEKDPSLAGQSYDVQYRTIMDDCFSFADFWKVNLEKTGRFEALEIIPNAEPLQKKWAEEHNVSYSEENWKYDILESQLKDFKPDIVFTQTLLNPQVQERLKKNHPTVRLVIGWDGMLADDPEKFKACDMVLSDDPLSTQFYKEHGFISYHFTFGFEKKILEKIRPGRERYNVSFIGSLQMENDYHVKRLGFLSQISMNIRLSTWIPYFPALFGPIRKNWIVQTRKMKLRNYPAAFQLFTTNHGGVYGLDMYQILADSKITLNMHADEYVKAGNMRLWEATGAGTCLVTDYKDNVGDYFEPGKEIVTYTDTDDAVRKIKYLLAHDEERRKIAAAGQKKTLEQYSLERRIAVFSEFLIESFNAKKDPSPAT